MTTDMKTLTANDVQSYWRCRCGRLFVKCNDGKIITLFDREKRKKLPQLDLRKVFYSGIAFDCPDCRNEKANPITDTKNVTSMDVNSYWRCRCGRLSIKLENGQVITLFPRDKRKTFPKLDLRYVRHAGITVDCAYCRKSADTRKD